MAPRSKGRAQTLRPGFNKYGFRIKKPDSHALAQEGKDTESKATGAPAAAAKGKAKTVRAKASGSTKTAKAAMGLSRARATPDASVSLPSVPSPASATARQIVDGPTVAVSRVTLVSSQTPEQLYRGDEGSTAATAISLLELRSEKLASAVKLDTAGLLSGEHEQLQRSTQKQAFSVAANKLPLSHDILSHATLSMRHRTPGVSPELGDINPSLRTPAFMRQLKEAAQSPGNGSTRWSIFAQGAEESPTLHYPQSVNDDTVVHAKLSKAAVHRRAISIVSLESVPEDANPSDLINVTDIIENTTHDAASLFTLTSSLPKLTGSTAGYDEYSFTTTYRVPHDNHETPRISVRFPSSIPNIPKVGTADEEIPATVEAPAASNDTDQTSKSPARENSAPLTAPATASATAPPTDTTTSSPATIKQATFNAVNTRRRNLRSRSATPFEYRFTSTRSRTQTFHKPPTRYKTPLPRAIPRHTTPSRPPPRTRPPITRGTTPRRKETWHKAITALTSRSARLAQLTRLPLFTQPIREPISSARLELFWRVLTELIDAGQLFDSREGRGWEYIGVVVRLVNERIGREGFGQEEGASAARELMGQRKVMFSAGKVFLTRDAL